MADEHRATCRIETICDAVRRSPSAEPLTAPPPRFLRRRRVPRSHSSFKKGEERLKSFGCQELSPARLETISPARTMGPEPDKPGALDKTNTSPAGSRVRPDHG